MNPLLFPGELHAILMHATTRSVPRLQDIAIPDGSTFNTGSPNRPGDLEPIFFCLILGVFAGTMAGLLGVGGGLIIVPALVYLFHGQGLPPGTIVHLAIGTSLSTIVFTSIASLRAHHRHGAVRWEIFWRLTPGIIVGALIGSFIADALGAEALRRVFGVFELLIAAQMLFGRNPAAHRTLPGTPGMSLAGGVIGSVSALVGIGGGTLTVPFLAWCNVNLRNAVATSAACGLPIAIAGAAGFIVAGWDATDMAFTTGYVYWPAFAGIVLTSMLFAPLGAKLTHTLPVPVLRKVFALFLVALGARMLLA